MQDASKMDPGSVDLILSCIEADAARELEPKFAKGSDSQILEPMHSEGASRIHSAEETSM